MLSRLRAALTPQALLFLAAVLLLAGMVLSSDRQSGETTLEKRIGAALSAVDGAGDVRVVIAVREKEAFSALGYSEKQSGEVPTGAVAVAPGAGDPFVKAELTQALCALLGLPASAVSVVTGGGE